MPIVPETIAPDAIFITFPMSDGDSSRRPDNMNLPSRFAREVNWHRTMTMEEKYTCRWRNLIGQGIAMLLDKPEKEKYCLKEFPSGYWMFDHNKGPIHNIRHDLYLYGSRNVLRFRSPAEFIPHGFWLLTDPTLNRSNCGCKYCGGGGKRTQTEISEALGLPSNRGPMAVTGGSKRMRIGVNRPSRYAKTHSAPSLPEDTPWIPLAQRQEWKMDPTWRTSSLKLKFAANSTRMLELTSARRFRIGELVWCVWDEGTIYTFCGTDFKASFWPAIVLECSLESVVDHTRSSNGPYSVLHRRNYSLLRLGAPSDARRAQFECIQGEDSILPWQAHHVDLPSWPTLNEVSIDSIGQANPYTLALHTGNRLAESWAVCSRYSIRLSNPSVFHGDTQKTEKGASNFLDPEYPATPDRRASPALSSHTPAPHPIDIQPQRSPVRLKPLSPTTRRIPTGHVSIRPDSTASSMDGLMTPESSRTVQPPQVVGRNVAVVTETRYEGFWYGAERIWIGDVVRLCPEREAFASSLQLSHTAHEDRSWKDRITPSPGAAMRGVLLKIDRIFVRVSDTGSKECAIAGGLYEVAPQDWIDAKGSPEEASQSYPSGASSVSYTHEVYYPWDMPTTPPPQPSQEAVARKGHYSTRPPSLTLPPAPPGYRLRPLLPPESEIAFPAHFIAGRYYPDILQWRASVSVVPQISQIISSESLAGLAAMRGVGLLSLCGLAPGRFNRAVCVVVRLDSRTRMIEESAYPAGSQHNVGEEGIPMDVDD